ncbi:MAG TPA: 2-hydroxyacid dehydrogenase [Bacteroidales bacterium]|nr:2-hydroxyacid dehydrogenase [Bacteroidales bacterium]
MAKIAFFSTKIYDRQYFENSTDKHQFEFFESRLRSSSLRLVKGFDGVCVFVNDSINADVLRGLDAENVRLVALRCAGFNNVDLKAAQQHNIRIMRVPAYSPEAVAEHAVALMMSLTRKTHKAYNRVREGNFSIERLMGFTIHGKTVGVCGTGRIGQAFCRILSGFGAKIIASDKYHSPDMLNLGVKYLGFDEILEQSDILSLHCPLTPETHHVINAASLKKMKKGAMLINTSRGKLVDTAAVIEALRSEQIGALAIDVYEQEEKLFFRDLSEQIIRDEHISRLMIFPNVIITAHQGYFTHESMEQITAITLQNFDDFVAGNNSENEVNCAFMENN